MSRQQELLTKFELRREEIAKNPDNVFKKIRKQFQEAGENISYVILGATKITDYKIILRVIQAFIERGPSIRKRVSEERINELMEFYLVGEDRAEVDLALERDNAALRAKYLKETECYTATQIRSFQSGSLPQNPSYPAAGWKREKRIFAIPVGNADYFPFFQFKDGVPHPAMKKILQALPDDMSTWQIALWFASSNGWLNNKRPQDCLGERDLVVGAAEQLNTPAVG